MNIIEYVANSHRTLEEKEFCDVDSLILCQIYYAKLEYVLDGEGVDRESAEYTLKQFNKAEFFEEMFNDAITDEDNFKLLQAAFASRRYRDLKIKNIVAEIDPITTKQFAAACYELDENTDYVCFRGTDGTMLGWKEDFELAFKPEAPSQADAVEYLEKYYGKGTPGENKRIYIGGHSKGGNLAIYAGLMCSQEIQDRIIRIYSLDGPGFRSEVADMLTEIIDRGAPDIAKQVPQASVIGMLLHQLGDYCVIKSNALGIMQHAAYSWEIEDDAFIELEHVTRGSQYVDRTVQAWLATVSDEKREHFIEALFEMLFDNGISTVQDLRDMKPTTLIGIKRTFESFDDETRNLMETLLRNLARTAIREVIPEEIGERIRGEKEGIF